MPLQILGAREIWGTFGWWPAEETTSSRGVLVTSNHGKDKKGLHVSVHRLLLGLSVLELCVLWAGIWTPDGGR